MKHGRVSAAQLAVTPVKAVEAYAPPPSGFSKAQAGVWRSLIAAVPPDWYRPEMLTLFARLCRVTVQLERVEDRLEEFGEGIPEEDKAWHRYKELTAMAVTLAGQMTRLSGTLRLTPQSWTDPVTVGRQRVRHSKQRPLVGPKPWNGDDAHN